MKRKIVIVGATSTIAERCARIWITQDKVEMILVGRNAQGLDIVAQDLMVRKRESRVETRVADFIDPEAIRKLVNDICANGTPEIVLIAHGTLPEQSECQDDLDACKAALEVNGISPALFAEAFAGYMDLAGRGTLAIIGSVAGDRGRQSNYVYGAAKGLLARYAQGLQHRFHGRSVRVVLVKPGPTDTRMTARLKHQAGKFADPEEVAARIVDGIAKGQPVVYAPRKWAMIMMVIRHIPGFIFGRWRI